jgi:hypothetical protein
MARIRDPNAYQDARRQNRRGTIPQPRKSQVTALYKPPRLKSVVLPAWAAIMAKRRRKSLVVCLNCHAGIHTGKASGENHGLVTGEPDARKAGKSGSGGGCPEKARIHDS